MKADLSQGELPVVKCSIKLGAFLILEVGTHPVLN